MLAWAGCQNGDRAFELQKEVDRLQADKSRLERELAWRDADMVTLTRRVTELQQFPDAAGATIFAPASLRIGRLTRARDYDGAAGSDGVTVYLQPLDADGNVVTVGGRITVQLIDNSDMARPAVVGLTTVERPEALRQAWHGRFLTSHYVVECPWLETVERPSDRELDVNVEFVDYLTGATHRAHTRVRVESDAAEGVAASADRSSL